MKEQETNNKAIVVAVVAAIGVLGAALIGIVPALFRDKQSDQCFSKADTQAIFGVMSGLLTGYVWIEKGKSKDEVSPHILGAVGEAERSDVTSALMGLKGIREKINRGVYDPASLRWEIDGTVDELKKRIDTYRCQ